MDASGQIGSSIVFSKWKGRAYARRYVIPVNPKTTEQTKTRTAFQFLNDIWRYWPSGAKAAWSLYATNNRFIDRNGFMKLNVSPLRTATDLSGMTISVAAGSGIAAAGMTLTPGAGQITVALTAPTLPSGWSITNAWALAIADVNPQTEETTSIVAGSDSSDPYSIVLAGLTTGQIYRVGGWFEFTTDTGAKAYGVSIQDVATPT